MKLPSDDDPVLRLLPRFDRVLPVIAIDIDPVFAGLGVEGREFVGVKPDSGVVEAEVVLLRAFFLRPTPWLLLPRRA